MAQGVGDADDVGEFVRFDDVFGESGIKTLLHLYSSSLLISSNETSFKFTSIPLLFPPIKYLKEKKKKILTNLD